MNELVKTLLSLSVSGTLLLLLVLGMKPLYKNRLSRCWQYYIWAVVALRFLLPFTLDSTIVGGLFEGLDQGVISGEVSADPNAPAPVKPDSGTAELAQGGGEITASVGAKPLDGTVRLFLGYAAVALVCLVRRITVYQEFIRYIKAGGVEASDIDVLNQLSVCKEKLRTGTRVELCRSSLIASPVTVGLFRPKIVLPVRHLEERDLEYIFLHELVHCKRRDMLYKWLIQVVVCFHWFNPFVYLLEREVGKACELSCDERVLSVIGEKEKSNLVKCQEENKKDFLEEG